MNRYTILTIGILVFLMLSGCSKNAPLQGKVTFEDGSHLTVGMVNFTGENGLSRGKIQSDGTYRVGSFKSNDGLLPGKYKVYITGASEPIEPTRESNQKDSMGNPIQMAGAMRLLIDPKYVTAETTPLTRDVPASGNRFDITVPAYKDK